MQCSNAETITQGNRSLSINIHANGLNSFIRFRVAVGWAKEKLNIYFLLIETLLNRVKG